MVTRLYFLSNVFTKCKKFVSWNQLVKHSKVLKCLILTSHLGIECVALSQFISFMKDLKKLSFRDCIMEYLAFCELAKLLMKDNEITQLSLQHLDMKMHYKQRKLQAH